jgi:nucleoside-diphosphate-sugar epimerase
MWQHDPQSGSASLHSDGMRIFATGSTGYIGGVVVARLAASGHDVRGLIRRPEHVAELEGLGVSPVLGSLDDSALLAEEAGAADAVINAADSDHLSAVEAMLGAMEKTERPQVFVHTSGTSVVGDDAAGAYLSPKVFDDRSSWEPGSHPFRQRRAAVDTSVVEAGRPKLRTVVLCHSLIYGTARGKRAQTVLLEPLIAQARESGVVRVVGDGSNAWSTIHLDDVAGLYLDALADSRLEGFFFTEAGESSFAEIGTALAEALSLGPVEGWSVAEAAAAWGEGMARSALGGNSRVRAGRLRDMGWRPNRTSITDWIVHESGVRR